VNIEKWKKEAFAVIGKEGSTMDGEGFIQRLWEDANAHFDQVQLLAKTDQDGVVCGIWGVMSDFSRSFQPWEEGFTKGLYLAGVECTADAQPPKGWVRWNVPGFTYLRTENEGEDTFAKMLQYLEDNQLSLEGAVHDYTSPQTGKSYMVFPIQKD